MDWLVLIDLGIFVSGEAIYVVYWLWKFCIIAVLYEILLGWSFIELRFYVVLFNTEGYLHYFVVI